MSDIEESRKKTMREHYARNLKKRLTKRQVDRKYIPKYFKPKLRIESAQFPFRCPVCWDKHLYREQGKKCLDDCWDSLPTMIWEMIKRGDKEPKEVGSWQWDLDKEHHHYCGIIYYDNGDEKPFKNIDGELKYISLEELETLLKKGCYLWQRGNKKLPEKIRKFGKAERPKPHELADKHPIEMWTKETDPK